MSSGVIKTLGYVAIAGVVYVSDKAYADEQGTTPIRRAFTSLMSSTDEVKIESTEYAQKRIDCLTAEAVSRRAAIEDKPGMYQFGVSEVVLDGFDSINDLGKVVPADNIDVSKFRY
ncbi:hypothetical protein CANCADRAFT_57342 [Tortispora caseinolytica NRRL Y-17796]|uniref:Uncharacterized protein n=1 Tax=Tortispora caseinolytica NRRL Y-17796 TaxID=767744 RepID=A0A1E4TGS0_9ASCO|nr:hypothetical protein CANCADRAFT_57342 [Tortispora caseinolytica NRRL Y-17796]